MRARLASHPAFNDALLPLEALLTTGGDARLELDRASGLNVYGCRPRPRPEALSFSSSTASTISARAWRHAHAVWRRLDSEDGACDELVEEARATFAGLLGLVGTGTEIVFAPSGTDAMLHALAIARIALPGPAGVLLSASDETGSGARHAVHGRHFCHVTAQGRAVEVGGVIAGLGEAVRFTPLPLRDEHGMLYPREERDRHVRENVAAIVASGSGVVLFAMDHSKLGHRSPSPACLDAIEAEFGDAVQIIIDACQTRIGVTQIQRHLARGHMVLVTGSKFFAGPPLSGALLVPPVLGEQMRHCAALPAGLRDYSVASDWPGAWPSARASLPRRANPGQLLRWTAALAEMEDWMSVPAAIREMAIRRFADATARILGDCAVLEPLAHEPSEDDEFPCPTIFPFLVRHSGTPLSPAQCGALFRALNRDMTPLLPADLTPDQRDVAALPCHIGQPVTLAGTTGARAALRVSACARMLCEVGSDPAQALRTICAKIELLVTHFDAFARVV